MSERYATGSLLVRETDQYLIKSPVNLGLDIDSYNLNILMINLNTNSTKFLSKIREDLLVDIRMDLGSLW